MYHYRLILEDGTYHYVNGDCAAQVKRTFTRKFPALGKVIKALRMGPA